MFSYVVKPGIINISAIEDVICATFVRNYIHSIHIIHRRVSYMYECRYLCGYIVKSMKLYPSFSFTKLCPPKYIQASINRRRIKSIDFAFNFKVIICPFLTSNINHVISIIFKYLAITIFISF